MSRPNFRIIEGDYKPTVDIESFKEDYMNPFISKDEILKKYDLNHRRYLKYGNMVYKETGFKRTTGHSVIKPMTHIRETPCGYYRIDKQINRRNLYCGTYDTVEEARRVRDYLIKNNWTDEAIDYCMNGGLS